MIILYDGQAIAACSKFQVEYNSQSTEDSGRDLDGKMYNKFLDFKYKLICEWPPQTVAARATLMSILYGASNLSAVSIKFLDPLTNTQITRTFYVGTPASTDIAVWDTTYGRYYWGPLTLNFIEV